MFVGNGGILYCIGEERLVGAAAGRKVGIVGAGTKFLTANEGDPDFVLATRDSGDCSSPPSFRFCSILMFVRN